MFADRAWTCLVSQSCHGRVTISIEFRRMLDIVNDETLEMRLEGGELRVRRLEPPSVERLASANTHHAGAEADHRRAEQ